MFIVCLSPLTKQGTQKVQNRGKYSVRQQFKAPDLVHPKLRNL